MGLNTKIQYVTATHNFWLGGCNKISEGCRNCFAETMFKRFYGNDFSVPIKSKNFDAPLKWKKPQVILVNDMSDFFHVNIRTDWALNALKVMREAKQHIFLLLTKRPKNIFSFYEDGYLPYEWTKNIWLGVSVENQKTADERIPELLEIPHFKKWLSVEPLLEEIDLIKTGATNKKRINWIVVGGETSKGARPMRADWARYLQWQCKSASVPFFMKQMSNKAPIPKDLMVREYPKELEVINDIHGKKD